MAAEQQCAVCGLSEGDTSDGLGPLGPVERCETCGKLACPVCRHEADCCFEDEADHADDPAWAPKGWRRLPPQSPDQGFVEWERV